MAKSPLLHFHLVSAMVVFQHDDAPEPGSVPVNCAPRFPDKFIRRMELDGIHRLAQQVFFSKMPTEDQPKIRVLDVIINGISYLGHMSEETFMADPPGFMKIPLEEIDS